MSDADESPVASNRPGSAVDLSRRMDRMERRQDTIEGKVTDLAAVVARVEQNQTHATELNKLRFDALDSGLKSVGAQLSDFVKRIEGLISGEVRLPQSERMMNEYIDWKREVDRRLDARDAKDQREGGILAAFGGIKTMVLVIAAAAAPIVTVIALLMRHQP